MHILLAYIDPGSGSIFLQALIGAALAGGYMIRNSLGRFIMFIRKRLPGSRKNDKNKSDKTDPKQ